MRSVTPGSEKILVFFYVFGRFKKKIKLVFFLCPCSQQDWVMYVDHFALLVAGWEGLIEPFEDHLRTSVGCLCWVTV